MSTNMIENEEMMYTHIQYFQTMVWEQLCQGAQ
jgi:hypothetical protein